MNLISEDYLMHHGVKGMKWGVRHDKPSVGRRYSEWGRKTSNKMYDKMTSNVESRRQKNKSENWAKNSNNKTVARYGNWVDRTSDKKYNKKIKKIEDRRQRKMQEFEEFDKALDAKDKAVKSTKNYFDSKLGKVSKKTSYSKPSDFFKQAGKNFVQNNKQGLDFYKKSYSSIKNGKPKEIGKHYVDWLNQDMTVIGITGSKTMKRKRYMSGLFNPLY